MLIWYRTITTAINIAFVVKYIAYLVEKWAPREIGDLWMPILNRNWF